MKSAKRGMKQPEYTVFELIEKPYLRNRQAVAALSAADILLLRERQEIEAAGLRERFPVGKTYFSYILKDDSDYRILESLPTLELVDRLNAMRLTAGMIAGISEDGKFGRSMIVVAMHHNSRVVEFEFDLVVNHVGDTVLYEPLV